MSAATPATIKSTAAIFNFCVLFSMATCGIGFSVGTRQVRIRPVRGKCRIAQGVRLQSASYFRLSIILREKS
jgi:hypothetical protein